MSGSYVFVVGAIFCGGCWLGRWLQRAVERFPRHLPLRKQLRSLWSEGDCRRCTTRQSGIQHVPILSWLMAGRCRGCGRKMDSRRPLVEFLTGVLLAGLYWSEIPHYGSSVVTDSILWTSEGPNGPQAVSGLWSPLVWLHLRYLLHAVMICGLIVATVIDLELYIIPDGCTVPVLLFALLFSFAAGQSFLVPLWFQDMSTGNVLRAALPDALRVLVPKWDAIAFAQQHPHWHGLLVSVAGMIVGAASVWFIRVIGFWALQQEAMGDGDVVLMAMIGSVIGWQPVLTVFFLAPPLAIFAALGTWVMRRRHYISYGPWLSVATLLLLLGWRNIWPHLKRLFDMGPVLFLMGVVLLLLLGAMLFILQRVKQALGWTRTGFPAENAWTSADHLTYYGSERPDEQTGQWSRPQWPGCRSGRGLRHYRDWRRE